MQLPVLLPLAPHARRERLDDPNKRWQDIRKSLLRLPDGSRMSIYELSKLIPADDRHLRNVLAGKSRPSFRLGLRIAQLLKISPYMLQTKLAELQRTNYAKRDGK